MLKRQSKTEKKIQKSGPPRILVVDDNPDAACLIGKLFRRAGYEVAEIGDPSVALMTLANETTPISAVVGSFSISGNPASLKLLDSIRHSDEQRVSSVRVAIMLDGGRQQLVTWQSAVDEVIMRPYGSDLMLEAIAAMLERTDDKRADYRRTQIERLTSEAATSPDQANPDDLATPGSTAKSVMFK